MDLTTLASCGRSKVSNWSPTRPKWWFDSVRRACCVPLRVCSLEMPCMAVWNPIMMMGTCSSSSTPRKRSMPFKTIQLPHAAPGCESDKPSNSCSMNGKSSNALMLGESSRERSYTTPNCVFCSEAATRSRRISNFSTVPSLRGSV
eukprot:Lithocolla_globosa_v1_NODE_214_length_5084_cov_10.333665.p3 type:complete len:146 gc:universal NODE_214_length_5084_cov_10.333665:3612-3175(-)